MGLEEDLKRFREVGEKRRMDLKEFLKKGEIETGDEAKIPIKIVELPSFEYDYHDSGGIEQGDVDIGDPVDDGEKPVEGDEAGDEGGEDHEYYEMDPEEFAEELDEELDLDLKPKDKVVKEKKEGAMVDLVRSGSESTLDFETMWKRGLKRKMAMYFDEDYIREVLKVEGFDVDKTYRWARENNIPVSKGWIAKEYENIKNTVKYDSLDEIEQELQNVPASEDIKNVPLRNEDKRYKHPEIIKEYESKAVIVMIRDVSGSMREEKRELVERIFSPLDWYLTGKYDNAEFIYIAHDAEAWEVERRDFFGIRSKGGTVISSAYELAQEILDERFPWDEWNRYVFAAGDGENWSGDTENEVIPIMKEVQANLHGYIQVEPESRWGLGSVSGQHGKIVEEEIGERENVVVTYAEEKEDAIDCIEEILSTEDNNDD